ncbi:MAG: VWA domain-containing protein [Sphingomonadaceae bacterium]|nr:VWA domain-containing protein [Sphingomonadaceae bacterium]
MFIAFLNALRAAGLGATLHEHLTLLSALKAGVVPPSVDDFYVLARATYVKDEGELDRFDRVFGQVFSGIDSSLAAPEAQALPEEWLRTLAELHLSPEERAKIDSLGSWDAIMAALRERLGEQQERHQGGNRWIGTGGTSPFGAYGYNPEGVRIGQAESRHRRAVKVWDKREFRNLDRDGAIGPRTMQVALRRLRRFAREGAADELDLEGTITGTAKQGWLDVRMRPERHNAVKVLLLLDVGGSMDDHVRVAEQLFAAARSEFKHLEYWYFHNCVYEHVWKDNRRRMTERTPTSDLIQRFGRDWKLVFVGDASMSPYELTMPGGSVEHMNPEPGLAWLRRLTDHFGAAAWLNPVDEEQWGWTSSIGMVRDAMAGRMHPLTLAGLDAAAAELTRRH